MSRRNEQDKRKKKLNIPLLKKVRAAIESERNGFDMGTWGVIVGPRGRGWWPLAEDEPAYLEGRVTAESCGTPACLAGWAIRLAGNGQATPEVQDAPVKSKLIGQTAMRLLGLGDAGIAEDHDWRAIHGPGPSVQHPLFWHEEWPRGFPHKNAEERRASAIRLLDALIEGNDPWEGA